MEQKEIEDGVVNWLKGRLSPYFISVMAVWIVYNRVLVFALFNFDDHSTLQERIVFVHGQLDSFTMLDFISGFKGFWATVVWSLFWGFFVMPIYEVIGTTGETLYEWVHKLRPLMLAWISPSKWKLKSEYDDSQRKVAQLEEELRSKNEDVSRNQSLQEDSRKLATELEKQGKIKDDAISKNEAILKQQSEQLQKFIEDANKFKIVYASYGVGTKLAEVTKVVSELLLSRGKFFARNEILGIDPLRYAVKKLRIEYQVDGERRETSAYENEEILLEGKQIKAVETKDSITMRKWEENKIKLSEIFNGEWTLESKKNSEQYMEELKIDRDGKYLVKEQHVFDLLVIELKTDRISILKINLQTREQHSKEDLEILSENFIKGRDDLGFSLEYRKQPRRIP